MRGRPTGPSSLTPHRFWSDGPIHTDVEGMPNILGSAVIARAHLDDYALPFLSLGVQRVLFGLLAPLGRALGYSARYPLEAQGHSRDDSFHRRSACGGSTGMRFAVAQGDQIRGSKSNGSGDVLFSPIQLGPLEVKNRLFRSSIAGRFDNYDGSGTPVRINWDLKFARGGAGAIISSNAPVSVQGRLVPGYALSDDDDKIPFWREVGKRIHEHDCKYILQLAHAGRERLVGGIEYPTGLSSTSTAEPVNGFPCASMTTVEIHEVIEQFAQAARRAREAGLDGVELAGANGVLFTQFLSSAINDRKDEWGGRLENRARFALEVVRAVKREAGDDFCLGFKISLREHLNEIFPWLPKGNPIEESLRVCRWLEEAGVHFFHVSAGAEFPHPRNPAGEFPVRDMIKTYDGLISQGKYTFRNYLIFRWWPSSVFWKRHWEKPARAAGGSEGINLPDAKELKQISKIPVLVTGGFQTASVIRGAIERGDCDGVTMARTLVANPDLPNLFAAGADRAPRPCTYCNKCLFTFIENPLGCYDERRFDSREEMVHQIMSVYEPYAPPTHTGAASEVVA